LTDFHKFFIFQSAIKNRQSTIHWVAVAVFASGNLCSWLRPDPNNSSRASVRVPHMGEEARKFLGVMSA
jgi:hypothetical protein